jgi:hypothetical protein
LRKARQRKRLVDIKTAVANYKLERGCKDCGYNKHHFALQFDHVRGEKLGNIATKLSWSFFREESKKCEVVCANCHAVRTYGRHHMSMGYSSALDGVSDGVK